MKFWKKDIDKTEGQPQDTAAEAPTAEVAAPATASAPAATEAGSGVKEENKTAQQQAATSNNAPAQQQAPASPGAPALPTADVIDLGQMFRQIAKQWKVFAIVLPIVFVLACLHIFNVPRYYTTSTSLAPEIESPAMGGSLSSIASSFGFDLSDMETTDAITPLLYPDLMDDNKFIVDLFKVQVATSDDSLHCDYYTYLTKHQEQPWTAGVRRWMRKHITGEPKPEGKQVKSAKGDDPYILPKKTDDIVNKIREDIKISVDKKTGVISITATAQDPLVCKTLADSVTRRLQEFITTYRTSKAQKDVDYYKHLREEAQKSYEQVRRKYAVMSDANQEAVLETVKSELEDMENDMQLKYNQYTTYDTQYQAAIAKLREKTPAFTTLKGANVPVKPAGPKRVLFIAEMLIVGFCITSLYVLRAIILPDKE